jgi:serine/threonine protein kinase
MPKGGTGDEAGSDPLRRVREEGNIIPPPDRLPVGTRQSPPDSASVANLDEYVHTLVELGIVEQAELAAFEASKAAGISALARALVEAGKLTPYQASAVYQKKTKGLIVGNYLVMEKLGQGGMGKVFKARHRPSSRVVAIKVLPPSFARDRTAVLRFRREVEAARLLKHKNLVTAMDADEDRGVPFLIMDYIEGHDLDQRVREHGPMPIEQAVDCLIQVARGLEAAHGKGIIHRDIKPANIMLDLSGTARVLDLGLARVVDQVNPFNKTEGNRLTQSGMYMGTIDYMAPEQIQDTHSVDHRADIYSLGCTLYYLLTGQEPFWGETVFKRLSAHIDSPAPSLRILRPDVSPALDAAYLKMMAKRREDRPASMTAVIAYLEASKIAPGWETVAANAPQRNNSAPTAAGEQHLKRAGPARTKADPSIFARPKRNAGLVFDPKLSLSDLVADYRPDEQNENEIPTFILEPEEAQPLARVRAPRRRRRVSARGLVALVVLVAAVGMAVAFVRAAAFAVGLLRDGMALNEALNGAEGEDDRSAGPPPAQPRLVKDTSIAATAPGQDQSGNAVWVPGAREAPKTDTPERKTQPAAQPAGKEITGWGTAYDPGGDCQIDANGGALTITVPPTLHDLNAEINLFNAPRVVREVEGDFDIQVKVVGDFSPGNDSNRQGGLPFNGAGIVAFLDGDSVIRLERGAVFNGNQFGSFAIFEQHEAGSGVADHNGPLDPGTTYLRLARRGSRFLGFTSSDGRRWSQLNPINPGWPARLKVGLSAINSSNSPFSVRFEELSFKTAKSGNARR